MKINLVLLVFILSSCTSIKLYKLKNLEGLSGLSAQESKDKNEIIFWSHTDRGPNAKEILVPESGEIKRPFVRPHFKPYWIKFSLNKLTKEIKVLEKRELGLSGLPNKKGDETPLDLFGNEMNRDPLGIDPESICFDGVHVWMGEEYGPSILKFSAEGKLLRRYMPKIGKEKENGIVLEVLPEKISQRRLNRGFEGIACTNNKIYAILQSPLSTDGANVLLLEFNPITEKVEREFLYPLESMQADKIGDLAVRGNAFYVIEQNGSIGPESFHRIYRFNIESAESKSHLSKELVIDLVKSGYDFADKVEGLVILDNNEIAIVNDNDFGLSGEWNMEDGHAPTDKSKLSVLGILKY